LLNPGRHDLLPGARRGSGRAGRIKQWVRDLVALGPGTTVMVTELACSEPGCPPRETVIAVFDEEGTSRHWKLHMAIEEVTAEDIEAAFETGC